MEQWNYNFPNFPPIPTIFGMYPVQKTTNWNGNRIIDDRREDLINFRKLLWVLIV